MKFSSFDRRSLEVLRASVNEALALVAAKHGINARAANITFSANNCKLAVEFSIVSETGEVQTRESDAFRKYAALEGLKPESLHQEFTAGAERYKIVGMATTSRRDNILVLKLSNGKQYWMNAATIRRALPAAVAEVPMPREVFSLKDVTGPSS